MRLTELSPKWIQPYGWSSTAAFYVGLSFLCSHCNQGSCPTCGKGQGHRLAVMFWPPIDPEKLMGRLFDIPDNGGHRRVSGETFDTLTLHPSIGFDNPPHFHGDIANGEITNTYKI